MGIAIGPILSKKPLNITFSTAFNLLAPPITSSDLKWTSCSCGFRNLNQIISNWRTKKLPYVFRHRCSCVAVGELWNVWERRGEGLEQLLWSRPCPYCAANCTSAPAVKWHAKCSTANETGSRRGQSVFTEAYRHRYCPIALTAQLCMEKYPRAGKMTVATARREDAIYNSFLTRVMRLHKLI